MSSINLLSEKIYNKIAAGEVIERPASVLKELVENSLDAGAGKISIRIGGGGVSLISVSDDGCGMDSDDALLCFEPHATSKIKTENDLESITSLGFRGEALPSIASVAKITLRTREKNSPEGVETIIEGGKMLHSIPYGCAPGTEITIRDLFFNTPARKKFLKKNATEEKHIAEMLINIALAHASTAFDLSFDGRTILTSSASSDISNRIRELFGKEYMENMLPLAFTERNIRITGFIGKRSFTKSTRSEQRVFVNARPVESQAVYRGIKEGFGPTLDKGRYPPCVLYITLPPDQVDVNVHPAKREVRFLSDYEVTSVVRNAVSTSLRTAERAMLGFAPSPEGTEEEIFPEKSLYIFPGKKQEETGKIPSGKGKEEFSEEYLPPHIHDEQAEAELKKALENIGKTNSLLRNMPPAPWQKKTPEKPAYTEEKPAEEKEDIAFQQLMQSALIQYEPLASRANFAPSSPLPGFEEKSQNNTQNEETQKSGKNNAPLGLRYIGIYSNSYILAEGEEGLVVIDQHAAHERVLFEKLLKGAKTTASQKLLLPITIELSRSDTAFLSRNSKFIADLGYEAEEFGMNTVKLNAIPAAMSQEDAGGIFKEMLSAASFEEHSSSYLHRSELDRFAMAACKAAIKANDSITEKEALTLLQLLADCEQPFACPHGRPTILNITRKELERRFGRR